MRNTKLTIVLAVLSVLTVGSATAAGYSYWQWNLLKKNPQHAAQNEVKALLAKVGELIVLPEGEEPTVATVSDPERLKDQTFFAKAQKGFKVLIYPNAKKAILYDPSAHKIVEVAPVNIGNPAAEAKPVTRAEEEKSE